MNLKFLGIISIFLIVLLLIAPAMATPETVPITTSQNWVCPTNVFIIQVKMTGGGPGATGGNATMMGYSGKNSTTLTLTDVSVTPGQSYPIVIGAGTIGSLGYSNQPLTNDNSFTSMGGTTTAFGNSVTGGGGAVFSVPRSPNGGNGYLSVNIATDGQDGYGNVSYATKGGTAGLGYGAAAGAGGMGGIGGTGGSGGNGAGGVVEITYDTDYSSVLIAGTVVDAMTDSPISDVSVNFVQLASSFTSHSDGSGQFSLSAGKLSTGYSLSETISKSGYYTETFSFVPYIGQVIPQNVALIPTTFNRGANGTISGLIRDQVGISIPNVLVSMTNTTGGTLSMTTGTTGFYYFQNVPRLSTWNAVFSAVGHANSSRTFDMGWY